VLRVPRGPSLPPTLPTAPAGTAGTTSTTVTTSTTGTTSRTGTDGVVPDRQAETRAVAQARPAAPPQAAAGTIRPVSHAAPAMPSYLGALLVAGLALLIAKRAARRR